MEEREAYERLAALFAVIDGWSEARESRVAVQPGSRLYSDDQLTNPYQIISHAVALSIGGARDHLHALRCLVVDAGALHMAAPFTLVRAAMENAAQALWLLRPPEQRVRVTRRFQMAVRDARERHRAMRLLIDAEDAHLLDDRDHALADQEARFAGLAEAAGISRHEVLRNAPGWAAMIKAAGSDDGAPSGDNLEGLWRIGSGYAHGQSWSLLGTASLEQLGAQLDDPTILEYRITADVPTVWTMASSAVLLLNEALHLRERQRLCWRGKDAVNM